MHCNFMFHLYCNFVSIVFTSKFVHLKLENIKNTQLESLNHVLRERSHVNSFWKKLGVPSKCQRSFEELLMDWLQYNSTSKRMSSEHG